MKQKFKELERNQIKRKLDWLYVNQDFLASSRKGWMRAVRKILAVTATQLLI